MESEMQQLEPLKIDLSGINLVEASAGTGKTYNITSLYIRALIERDISVGKILVVTYTEAATKELKDRLLKRIRQSISVLKSGEVKEKDDQFLVDLLDHVQHRKQAVEKLETAVRSFDEASVYTIHGFCYQALQEQAFDSRAMYDAEMIGDDTELLLEAVDDYWRNWMFEASEDESMHPLLKLITDNGYNPEKLTKELKGQLGKPYLKIKPEESETNFKQLAEDFGILYSELQQEWRSHRKEMFDLLDTGHLSYYTTNKLEKWFGLMDDFLQSDTPPTDIFTQFYRFKQSEINDSLKKGPQKKGLSPPQHSFFKKIDEYKHLLESIDKYQVFFKKDLFLYLQKRLVQKKEDLRVLSYDDLLLRLRNALYNSEKGDQLAKVLRTKYPIAMVDEFQDTDPSQYDIFRRIYADIGKSALFMIGDPKQSIYSFRGADVFSYLKARDDAPPENQYKLNQNYRSVPKLLKGLNAFFERHDDPFLLNKINYEKVEWGKSEGKYKNLRENDQEFPAVRFRRLSEKGQEQSNKGPAKDRVVEDTVKEVARLLQGGKEGTIMIGEDPVEAKDIAILVRRHKQADMISEALQEKGIKSVLQSDSSVFQSQEAYHLQMLLRAVAEPGNETLVKTALSLPLTGYSARELLEIEEDEKRWLKVLDQFAEWHKKWRDQGFAAMFRSLINEADIADHVIRYGDGERRLTNLLHLGELLQEEARHHKKGMQGILKWLARKRQEDTGSNREEEQLRLESDEDLVKIVTMHRSKGLEYPIVFCPFLWFGPHISENGDPLVYHDTEDPNTTILDFRGKSDPNRNENRRKALREDIAESLRLAYVAMTRAEQCLYLTWDYATCSEFSALGYLLQDPQKVEELLQEKFSEEKYEKPDGCEMHRAIANLCADHPDLFTMKTPDLKRVENRQLNLLDSEIEPSLDPRNFRRTSSIHSGLQVSSFSSLTSWAHDDPDVPDYDQFLAVDDPQSEQESDERNIFTFPRGPQPGTCIHKIFEEIDFQNPDADDTLITTELARYGIDKQWKSVVTEMLHVVTKANIHPQNKKMSLSAVQPESIVQELEFYYRTGDITSHKLLSMIRDDVGPQFTGEQSVSGFLKGYIDLTFEFNGKFYLLDYKTNHLGNAIADYGEEHLKQEMEEAAYDLQYHIYTIALHRFLKRRMKNYDYNQHFGGAFYLFLRGMNEDGREGIFFDRPPQDTIKELDSYLLSGGEHE